MSEPVETIAWTKAVDPAVAEALALVERHRELKAEAARCESAALRVTRRKRAIAAELNRVRMRMREVRDG